MHASMSSHTATENLPNYSWTWDVDYKNVSWAQYL